jgi:ion channel-forming bestrophin family protein
MTFKKTDFDRMLKTTLMLQRIWLFVLLIGVYSLIPVIKEHTKYADFADLPSHLFSSFGLVLSLVLVFRTNRAYDRWWEARTLWGKLVNISRSLAIKAKQLSGLDQPERVDLHRTIAGFAFALKEHLRSGVQLKDVPGWESEQTAPAHVPSWLMTQLYGQFKMWENDNRIAPEELLVIDAEAHEFLNVCGGCERIRNTLIAGSYRSYALKCLILYLLALPWGLVQELGWITIPAVMLIGYMMIGLETIADDVEEPFGFDLDDLDLDRLCKTIDVTTAEILEVEPLVKS